MSSSSASGPTPNWRRGFRACLQIEKMPDFWPQGGAFCVKNPRKAASLSCVFSLKALVLGQKSDISPVLKQTLGGTFGKARRRREGSPEGLVPPDSLRSLPFGFSVYKVYLAIIGILRYTVMSRRIRAHNIDACPGRQSDYRRRRACRGCL